MRGVSAWAFVFMATWGVWNMYYYPHLGQWASFAGGVVINSANVTWVVLAFRYRGNK